MKMNLPRMIAPCVSCEFGHVTQLSFMHASCITFGGFSSEPGSTEALELQSGLTKLHSQGPKSHSSLRTFAIWSSAHKTWVFPFWKLRVASLVVQMVKNPQET